MGLRLQSKASGSQDGATRRRRAGVEHWGIIGVALQLAYANGANDNVKGVASLLGGGVTTYSRAISWATAATLLGSLAAFLLAGGLLATFSGKGLVPDAVVAMPAFTGAVALSAGLTVLLASRLGLPISTTHALVGALVGAGHFASPAGLNLGQLGEIVLLPLIAGPLLAMLGAWLLYPRHTGCGFGWASSGRPASVSAQR